MKYLYFLLADLNQKPNPFLQKAKSFQLILKAAFLGFCCIYSAAGSNISVSGKLSADTIVWDSDTVFVTDSVTISCVKFKILPGTTVYFLGPYALKIAGSTIVPHRNFFFGADGTPNDSIFFTSPGSINWKGIQFSIYNISHDPTWRDTLSMQYCKIDHCTTNTVYAYSNDSNFVLELKNNLFINNKASAFCFQGSSVKIKILNNMFYNNIEALRGGAIRIEYQSSIGKCAPLINGNIFKGNHATEGGAIYAMNIYGYISDNHFQLNTATLGGAINENNSSMIIANNIINNNSVDGAACGGGIYTNKSRGTISGNLIVNNQGSGIHVNVGYCTIVNNTICNNSADNGGGIYWESSIEDTGICINNIIWGNHADPGRGQQIFLYYAYPSFSYCCIEANDRLFLAGGGPYSGIENSCFGTYPEFIDTSAGTFSLGINSPCINSGYNDTVGMFLFPKDLNQNNRIIGDIIDIGCYEFPDQTSSLNKHAFLKYRKFTNTPRLSCVLREPINNCSGITLLGRKAYFTNKNQTIPSGIYLFSPKR